MTLSPLGISAALNAFDGSVVQPANDRRAGPPRRVLPPPLRQEIAAMAAAYMRDLGMTDAGRLMGFGARLIERIENRAATPREDVMLTAFEEMQRLIGEEAGAAGLPARAGTAEISGRLGLWLASHEAAGEEAVPLASPLAPELPAMTPQPLDTWFERARALGRHVGRAVFGGGEESPGPAAIRIDR